MTAVRSGALAMGVVVLALVLAEALLRVTGLAYPGGVSTMTDAQFRRLPGMYAPNQRVLSRDVPALPHRVTIDSLGYRGAAVARVKPPGEWRVLFTGDSFTYGSYVDDSVTVPAILQSILERRCHGIRVINAGLGGSTITDQARIVARGVELAPDVVVVMFSENDVTDLGATPMWDRLAANREKKSRFPSSVVYGVLRHTALWNLVLRARLRFSDRAAASGSSAAATGPVVEAGLRARYAATLSTLRDTLAAQGIRLVFAVMPTHLTVNGAQSDAQYSWAIRLADSLALPHANILDDMRADRRGSRLYLLPYDGHASPAGNLIASAAIARVLADAPYAAPWCADDVTGGM
jgi:lysophospholipase L1-like esterase